MKVVVHAAPTIVVPTTTVAVPVVAVPSSQVRWCATCAEGHEGAVPEQRRRIVRKKCEDCKQVAPSFGLPDVGATRRWCKRCSLQHPGAIPHESRYAPKKRKLGWVKGSEKLVSAPKP